MCQLAVQQTSDCICGQEDKVRTDVPSCNKCDMLVFYDGTAFHELRCPNNTIVDQRDMSKLETEKMEMRSL